MAKLYVSGFDSVIRTNVTNTNIQWTSQKWYELSDKVGTDFSPHPLFGQSSNYLGVSPSDSAIARGTSSWPGDFDQYMGTEYKYGNAKPLPLMLAIVPVSSGDKGTR